MDAANFQRLLQEAAGYAQLGMWQDAQETVERLPSAYSATPEVVALRLAICAGLRNWAGGASILNQIISSHPLVIRAGAGRFCLAHAVELTSEGDLENARRAVIILARIWPEGKSYVLSHPALESMWP